MATGGHTENTCSLINVEGVTLETKPTIPLEVLNMDPRSIEMYRKALRNGKEKVFNIRIMVVGPYDVGKTTLTKRLLGKDVNICDIQSTEGIDVQTECCKVSLATREWITQEQNAEQNFNLQRLVKLFNEQVQQKSNDEKQLPKEMETHVFTAKQDKGHAQHDLSVRAKQDTDEEDIPTLSQPVEFPIAILSPEASSGVAKESKKKDAVMEILQLVNANSDKLEKSMEEYAKLGIWDFAGQFPFYTTHQTFLSYRAIYLLVLDLSQQITALIKETIDTWMNLIHSCTPSPQSVIPAVILVGTHVDKIPERYRHEVCERYFREIRSYLKDKPTRFHLVDEDFAIDNTVVDSKLVVLKQKIVEIASQQPHWGEEVPARWILLERELMRLKAAGSKVIPRTLLEAFNQAEDVRMLTDELDSFLKFQNDIGTILYFSIELFKDKIVLVPQWMIDALKSLITAEMFVLRNAPAVAEKWDMFNKNGKLSPELIDAIWTKEKYPDLHDNKEHILLLMEHLNIIARPRSFSEDGSEIKVDNNFLAPCMLKETTPERVMFPKPDPEMKSSSSVLCYHFMDKFLPSPIFHRLLATCVSRWPIAQRKSENQIFCGCCIFSLDLHHELTVLFREYIIFVHVIRFGTTEKTPSPKLCTEVQEFITKNLTSIIGYLGHSLKFEMSVQCPKSVGYRVDCLIPLTDLQENEYVPCHFHDDIHVIRSQDVLKFWFQEEVDKGQSSEEMVTHPSIQIPMDYRDDKQDNLTEEKICHLLSSESDLKAYISDDPSEACIKKLLSQASKQRSKESMKIILQFIVQQFTERFSEKHIRIWAGEKVIGPANLQTVLVCLYSGSCDVSLESFYDLKVIYRDYNTTDGESASARAHELVIKCDLTPEQCDLVNEAITIHGEDLFAKHSNLEALSSSGILSSNSRGLVQEPCVILYCRVKGIIPFGEMPFPKRLKVNKEVSIAVDVREGYFSSHADSNPHQESTFHHKSKQLKEPLRMGCSIGPAGRRESGTIGPFVEINSDRIGFLTCAHVVFCDSELIDLANITQTDPIVKEIVQPPDGDLSAPHYQYNHRLCGRVFNAMFRGDWSPSSDYKFGIDAAVIEITSRFPNAGSFVPIDESQLEDAGFSLDQPPKFDTCEMMTHPINRRIQKAVIKIGSETGLTRGLLRLTKGMVRYSISTGTLKRDNDRIEELKLTMHGLIEILPVSCNKIPFCTNGDSGAGVFLVDDDDDNNKLICVGLLFGVMSDGTGLAMPIDKVLTALHRDDGQQIKLKDFENEEFI